MRESQIIFLSQPMTQAGNITILSTTDHMSQAENPLVKMVKYAEELFVYLACYFAIISSLIASQSFTPNNSNNSKRYFVALIKPLTNPNRIRKSCILLWWYWTDQFSSITTFIHFKAFLCSPLLHREVQVWYNGECCYKKITSITLLYSMALKNWMQTDFNYGI